MTEGNKIKHGHFKKANYICLRIVFWSFISPLFVHSKTVVGTANRRYHTLLFHVRAFYIQYKKTIK
jgi:hypothetical protein